MEFDELISLLVEQSDLTKADIQAAIAKKKGDLNDLVTDEGAAYIVARELGIEIPTEDYTRHTITIRDLFEIEPGIGSVTITGKILRIFQPMEFKKEERKGIVQRILIADNSGEIELVLWNQMTQLIQEKVIERNDIIRIVKGYLKEGYRSKRPELHVSRAGKIETVNDDSVDPSNYPSAELLDLESQQVEVFAELQDLKGLVTDIGNIRTFPRENDEGKVANVTLQGLNGPVRLVFWNERAEDAFDFSPGDEIQIEGCLVKENRNGEPEIHTNRLTRITKLGSREKFTKKLPPPSTEKEITKITELEEEQRGISFSARLLAKDQVRTFNRKDGSTGRLQRITILLADRNPVTMVLWDDQTESLEKIASGDPIRISNGYTRKARESPDIEIHLGNFGAIERDQKDEVPASPLMATLEDLEEGKTASTLGVATTVSYLNEFNRQNGTIGHVSSTRLSDGTAEARLVCWNEAAKFLTSSAKPGAILEIMVANVKINPETSETEIHVNSADQVKFAKEPPSHLQELAKEVPEPEEREDAPERGAPPRKAIKDLVEGEVAEIKGMIVRIFQRPPYYLACPHCGKKAADLGDPQGECQEHGPVTPERRLLIPLVVDDSTGNLRTVLIGTTAEIAMRATDDILAPDDDQEIIQNVSNALLGKELLFQGEAYLDRYREEEEPPLSLRVQRVFQVNYEEDLIRALEEAQSS
ncbi:MAG: OB-fold nucleic acid binding domain-containing protein [Candidatus Hodarchaeales archaeon]|jgi:replication factor A1